MAERITWTQIGAEVLTGREAVIEKCEKGLAFLATVSSTITKLKAYSAGSVAIVEGGARFQDKEGHASSVASCDVFRFAGERLVEITSYVIELGAT
jgi:hypothetical protein